MQESLRGIQVSHRFFLSIMQRRFITAFHDWSASPSTGIAETFFNGETIV